MFDPGRPNKAKTAKFDVLAVGRRIVASRNTMPVGHGPSPLI
jgi:hypothetical protein